MSESVHTSSAVTGNIHRPFGICLYPGLKWIALTDRLHMIESTDSFNKQLKTFYLITLSSPYFIFIIGSDYACQSAVGQNFLIGAI